MYVVMSLKCEARLPIILALILFYGRGPSGKLKNLKSIGLTAGVTDQQSYSSMAPDPTSGVSRGPCKPDFYCGFFHYLNWTPILTTDFSVYLTSRTDFDSGLFRFPNLDTLILTDFYV